MDITGDGIPNLLVTPVIHGNAGYYAVDIFDVGDEFRHVQWISEFAGDMFDMNGNGSMEYVGRDWGYIPLLAYIPAEDWPTHHILELSSATRTDN